LKVGGQVTSDFRIGGGTSEMTRRIDQGYNNRTRGYVRLDARDNTEYGLLRTYASIYYEKSMGLGQTTSGTIESDAAFVQFGGLTAGRYNSILAEDYGFGSTSYAGGYKLPTLGVNGPTQGAFYTFSLGNGVSASLGFEDSTVTHMNPVGTDTTLAGQTAPDVVGKLKVDQAWGAAWLGAASHQLRSNNAVVSTDYGYAVLGGVKLLMPMLAAGSNIQFMASYADGAIAYAGHEYNSGNAAGNNFSRIGGVKFMPTDFNNDDPSKHNKAFYVSGALEHYWTPTVSSTVFGAYSEYNPDGASNNSKIYAIGTRTAWSPVKGLTIGAEVYYAKINAPAVGGGTSGVTLNSYGKGGDEVAGRLRVVRGF